MTLRRRVIRQKTRDAQWLNLLEYNYNEFKNLLSNENIFIDAHHHKSEVYIFTDAELYEDMRYASYPLVRY